MLSSRFPNPGLAAEGGGGGAPPPPDGGRDLLVWLACGAAALCLAPTWKSTGMSGGGGGILELEGGGGPLAPRWEGWFSGIGGASAPLGGGGGMLPFRPPGGGGGGMRSFRPLPVGGGGGCVSLIVFRRSTMSLCAASIPPFFSTISYISWTWSLSRSDCPIYRYPSVCRIIQFLCSMTHSPFPLLL